MNCCTHKYRKIRLGPSTRYGPMMAETAFQLCAICRTRGNDGSELFSERKTMPVLPGLTRAAKPILLLTFILSISGSSAQVSPPSVNEFITCKTTEQCSSQCECLVGQNMCIDQQVVLAEYEKCPACGTDDDCTKQLGDICDSVSGRCTQCIIDIMGIATKDCTAVLPSPVPLDIPEYSPMAIVPSPVSISSAVTDTFVEEDSLLLEAEPQSDPLQTAEAYAEAEDAESACISTTWLERKELLRAAFPKSRTAAVMCIPGLPCGTLGHILRQCSVGFRCTLVTYKEVCSMREDCISTVMKVSRLRHAFDWSTFHSGNLSLTSVSAHPESTIYDISRIIATIADKLNSKGLGYVCDALIEMKSYILNFMWGQWAIDINGKYEL